MKISQGFIVIAFFSMLLLLISGCGQKAPEPLEKIVLGTQAIVQSAPVWIAEKKGYFKEEGLNVEIREFASGRAALQIMLNEKGSTWPPHPRRRLFLTASIGMIMPFSAVWFTRIRISRYWPGKTGE